MKCLLCLSYVGIDFRAVSFIDIIDIIDTHRWLWSRCQVGFTLTLIPRTIFDRFGERRMLEYLYLLCLLCLTVSVPILIRGCFNIHKELPSQGQGIGERIDKVADLLDEMAELINNAIQFKEDNFNIAQAPTHPLMAFAQAFMGRNAMDNKHASKTQPEEWEIYPPNDTQTKETETILEQHSPVDISG